MAELFSSRGKFFGTATNLPYDDEQYMSILESNEFSQITPENAMKLESLVPHAPRQYDWTTADDVAGWASRNNKKLRCHSLIWYNHLPNWLASGRYDNATLLSIMTDHIKTVVNRYRFVCEAWDVVSEALNEDGNLRDDNIWYELIGPAFIPIAFQAAAEADPDAQLYYNDYNIEKSGRKVDGVKNIIDLIRASGARIDGVGVEGHFISTQVPEYDDMASWMREFTDKGVDVVFSELDVRIRLPGDHSKRGQQREEYGTICAACKNNSRCRGITVWDFTDKYSWIPDHFDGYGDACMWNDDLEKKPAYQGCSDVFEDDD
ncbi:putative xylanase 2 [Lineolata rhizophorae]|uniref:Beta-xylanase n=1 Tax=Lineolata rhizophorae TaxID=578093 RepID=A0A6A6P9A6_9PEZI|nr:putative xylanase 2 [Lineolata rhizophorae]